MSGPVEFTGTVTMPSISISQDILNNTRYGYLALGSVTTGTQNSAFGESTLAAITTGSDNVAMGFGALDINTEGNRNVAIGNHTLYATILNDNIAIGHNCLLTTAGEQNVSVGSSAGSILDEGHRNVFVGFQSGMTYDGSSTNNIAIGWGVGPTGATVVSNEIRIGNATNATCYIEAIRGVTPAMTDEMVIIGSDNKLGSAAIATAVAGPGLILTPADPDG